MKRASLGILLLLMVLVAALGYLNKEKSKEKNNEPQTTINITNQLDVADADDSQERETTNNESIASTTN